MSPIFNLPAPPGFKGLNPYKPLRVYYRHLPHWRQPGASYFVTFRLGDALPQSKVAFLQRLRAEWERTHPEPRSDNDWDLHTQEVMRHTERCLDEGYGACHFADRNLAEELEEALMHFQDQRYATSCWAIMPNHCHLVIRPFDNCDLEDILQGMKGVVARKVNKSTGGSGSIWQQESYDRIIRDEEHLWRVVQYIGRNPRLAGLASDVWRTWIHPEWVAAGWKFVDEFS